MFHKEVSYWPIFIIFLIVGLLLVENSFPPLTGNVIYTEATAEKVWDFSNVLEYSYNSSILLNGTVQLKPITITNTTTILEINESALLLATQYDEKDNEDDEDKDNKKVDEKEEDAGENNQGGDNNSDNKSNNVTLKLQSLGQGSVQLKNNKSVLEIRLDHQLQNNDQLALYLLSGMANGKVYLCENKDGCSLPAYGNLTLPSDVSAAWYNITLSGMTELTDTFFITSSDKITIDMVKGYKKSTRNETVTSHVYSSSASITTADLQPVDWKSWEIFSNIEQLNGQQVSYEYSTNSGATWNPVPTNGNLALVTENKLKFRITLLSNTSTAPIVNSMKVTYNTKSVCAENWTAQYGSCLVNNSRFKSYLDTNECGTHATLPSDNGTPVVCDYCTLFNCSHAVIEESLAEVRGNKTVYIVDAVAKTNTRLELEAANSASVEIIEYSHNIKNETSSSKPFQRYVSLESNDSIYSASISLYYNDTELTDTNIDESTLKIEYYNETIKQWEALLSIVNSSGNYVLTTVPHLSFYGLFGEQPSISPDPASPSTTGYRSGGGNKAAAGIQKEPTLEVSETVLSTQNQEPSIQFTAPALERSCDYVVEMTLPDQVIMRQNEPYQGEIVNTGNCKIAELQLELSPELQPMIDLSVLGSLSLSPGNKTNFILIRKEVPDTDLFSATSYVIRSLQVDPTASGFVVVKGHDDEGKVFRQELPLKLIFKNNLLIKEIITANLVAVVLLVLVSIYVIRLLRPSKRRKKKIKKVEQDEIQP
ncbi:MAG: hypothetical protein AABX31_02815 [Nanoarchaeota archaeon]